MRGEGILFLLQGTSIAEQLKDKEVKRHWYYNWLDRCKRLTTAQVQSTSHSVGVGLSATCCLETRLDGPSSTNSARRK